MWMGSWWFSIVLAAIAVLLGSVTGAWVLSVVFVVIAGSGIGIYLRIQDRRRK